MAEHDTDWRSRPTLSVREAAGVMGISVSTAYLAVRLGQWPTIKVGRVNRVLTTGLRRMLGEVIDTPAGAA